MAHATLYFAFGSNLDAAQMARRCPASSPIGPAVLRDHRLVFAGHSMSWGGPVATVRRAAGRQVHGLIWRVPPEDIEALDRYEGHPRVYRRTWRLVERIGVGRVRATTYVLPDGEPEGVPTYPYWRRIWDAYERLGFRTERLPLPVH